jgi:hypothetical protein
VGFRIICFSTRLLLHLTRNGSVWEVSRGDDNLQRNWRSAYRRRINPNDYLLVMCGKLEESRENIQNSGQSVTLLMDCELCSTRKIKDLPVPTWRRQYLFSYIFFIHKYWLIQRNCWLLVQSRSSSHIINKTSQVDRWDILVSEMIHLTTGVAPIDRNGHFEARIGLKNSRWRTFGPRLKSRLYRTSVWLYRI